MKKKSRFLLSSILTIALCISLITGATLALFTDESKVDIAVTSGKVQVTATIDGDTLTTGSTLPDPNESNPMLGSAKIEDGKLVISDMAPGDYVQSKVNIINESTIDFKWQVAVSAEEGDAAGLLKLLTVELAQGGKEIELGESVSGKFSAWKAAGEAATPIDVKITMPESVTSAQAAPYLNKTLTIVLTVNATQANAHTVDPDPAPGVINITKEDEMEMLQGAGEITQNVALLDDIELETWTPLSNLANGIEFDGKGNTITVKELPEEFKFTDGETTATVKNVTLRYEADFGKRASWDDAGEKTEAWQANNEAGFEQFANAVNNGATTINRIAFSTLGARNVAENQYEEGFAGETVELTQGIDLTDVTWAPIGTKENPFKGTFNGNGMTISNLTINQPEGAEAREYVGLFGYVDGGSVKNLTMTDVNVRGRAKVGAVIGYFCGSGALENVTLDQVVVASTLTKGDSYVLDHMEELSVGGIVGEACGSVSMTVDGSKLTEVTVKPLMTYTPSAELLTVSEGNYVPAQVLGNVVSSVDAETSVTLNVTGSFEGVTVEDPLFMFDETSVHIYTAEGFIYVADNYGLKARRVNGRTVIENENRPWLYQNKETAVKGLVLENDIDLTQDERNWANYCFSYGELYVPLGFTTFKSSLDGKGHTITYNIEAQGSGSRSYFGLFGELVAESSNTSIANKIENLVLDGSIKITGYSFLSTVGSLYGRNSAVSNFKISNVISKVGINLTECSSNSSVVVGGIAGSDAYGTIKNVLYTGTISLPEGWQNMGLTIGGIVGSNNINTSGCKITKALYAGATKLEGAYKTTDVSKASAGGIVGADAYHNGTLENIYSLNCRTIGQNLKDGTYVEGDDDAISETLTAENWADEGKLAKLSEAGWTWNETLGCPTPFSYNA